MRIQFNALLGQPAMWLFQLQHPVHWGIFYTIDIELNKDFKH